MAVIKLTVTDEEKEWLEYMAYFHGMPIFALILKYSMEQLEDEYDTQLAECITKKRRQDDESTIPMATVMQELNI